MKLNVQKGVGRWLVRAPLWLYRMRLGWLLGHRFLRLTHIGRKSGLAREAVLEMVRFDKETMLCIVASGWGERSQWLQNVMHDSAVSVETGRFAFAAQAERLSLVEAADELADYAQRNPTAFKQLYQLIMGKKGDGEKAVMVQQMIQLLPMVRLTAVAD